MARKSLVSVVADGLLDRIVSGAIGIDEGLPSEAVVGAEFDVSRVTVREAVRSLTAQGVVRVVSGKGSFVNPVAQWESLDAVLRYISTSGIDGDVALQLIEVRRMFETSAAALAAGRRTDADLTELDRLLGEMRAAHESADVDRFVVADLAFHNVILHASGNVFLGVLFEPLTRVLADRRAQTSRVPQIQKNAIEQHALVAEALRTGESDAARAAMDSHMDQTLDDLRHYVLGS
ncbi:FadR family transcriptional regulator [Agromyces atrinae]|uniref:FadR/GntR family transcriptional regulator n=1 Tax=Agromyces atrinae TaxID=592376 RepID=UPI001F585940|nr:FadR/GntR family transcriptional regulator [Agromyces atrinae]MCI2959300.1 FadR family transcriptional regulator [Agromyces atrinae]